MTHRDRAGDPPGRREAAGDAGHRQGFPTPSGGSPARPERRLPKAFGRRRPPVASLGHSPARPARSCCAAWIARDRLGLRPHHGLRNFARDLFKSRFPK